MANPIRYRTVKKAYRLAKRGPTLGSVQYLGRQAWGLSKSQPGGNYANPKRRRS